MLPALRDRTRAPFKTTFAVAVAAAAVLSFAAPATADPVQGSYEGGHKHQTKGVKLAKGDDEKSLSTSLLPLQVGGKELLTYCIDIHTRVRQVDYTERGWGATSLGDNAKHVNWILHNSVPYLRPEKLAEAADLPATPSMSDAVAGTQAAIWHYSDGYNLQMGDANREMIKAVYSYLTGPANQDGMENEPAPTLSLSPENVSGEPGTLLGPINVTTSAEQVNVSLAEAPDGAKLLGPDKKTEVDTAADGDKLWVSIPESAEDGRAKVNADLVTEVSPGRVFKADVPSQILILASSEEVQVHDEASVSWATVPTPAPGSSAEQVCEPDAGVKVVLTNEGDATAEFTVTYGEETDTVTVKAGEAWSAVIPVQEDTAYKITVKSGEYEKVYEGILDCLSNQPSAAPSTPAGGGGGNLPVTGLNGLTTILGAGAALLLAGLALLLVVRRRGRNVEA